MLLQTTSLLLLLMVSSPSSMVAQLPPGSYFRLDNLGLSHNEPYQPNGKIGFRRISQCNMTYVWLTPPTGSNLDAFAHAAACSRLQLDNGLLINSQLLEPQLTRYSHRVNRVDAGMNHIDPKMSASLIDMTSLDALLQGEDVMHGLARTGVPLAKDERYFYLSDRVGHLNLMVIMQPEQQLKLELINPLSDNHLLTPQHVLCFRKQCPKQTPQSTSEADEEKNRTANLAIELAKAQKYNRDLYLQLTISRIACALLSLLWVLFAIAALVLCLRLRYRSTPTRKPMAPPSELSVYRDPRASPSFYPQPLNGKINMGQSSTVYLTDGSPMHAAGLTTMATDTSSIHNGLSSGNRSNCDGAITDYSTYGAFAPGVYQLPSNCTATYTDGTGLVTLVPLSSRPPLMTPSLAANQINRSLLHRNNGSFSPSASANHSLNDIRASHLVRNGSFGRHSANNDSMHSDATRRKLYKNYAQSQVNNRIPITIESNGLSNSNVCVKVAKTNNNNSIVNDQDADLDDSQGKEECKHLLSFTSTDSNNLFNHACKLHHTDATSPDPRNGDCLEHSPTGVGQRHNFSGVSVVRKPAISAKV